MTSFMRTSIILNECIKSQRWQTGAHVRDGNANASFVELKMLRHLPVSAAMGCATEIKPHQLHLCQVPSMGLAPSSKQTCSLRAIQRAATWQKPCTSEGDLVEPRCELYRLVPVGVCSVVLDLEKKLQNGSHSTSILKHPRTWRLNILNLSITYPAIRGHS